MRKDKKYREAVIAGQETIEGNPHFKQGVILLDPVTGHTFVARRAYEPFLSPEPDQGKLSQSFSRMYPEGSHDLHTTKLPRTAQVIWVPTEEVKGL